MKTVVDRRARIARVRRVQHLQASATAAQAESKVQQLEGSAERLLQLQSSLAPARGISLGAQLSSAGELGARLEAARTGLTDAIVSARATATEATLLRIEARIRQESAERLQQRAAAALEDLRERRAPTGRGRRSGLGEDV